MLEELGFLAFDNRNADLSFQVVSRRYEKKSVVLTSNLAFAELHTVFPSATCATALVERVVHHADIVKIDGESYRPFQPPARSHSSRRAAPFSADPGAPPTRLAPSHRSQRQTMERWKDEKMIRRWVALGIAEAQKGFRRVKGYLHMSSLVAAIRPDATVAVEKKVA